MEGEGDERQAPRRAGIVWHHRCRARRRYGARGTRPRARSLRPRRRRARRHRRASDHGEHRASVRIREYGRDARVRPRRTRVLGRGRGDAPCARAGGRRCARGLSARRRAGRWRTRDTRERRARERRRDLRRACRPALRSRAGGRAGGRARRVDRHVRARDRGRGRARRATARVRGSDRRRGRDRHRAADARVAATRSRDSRAS